MENITNYSNEEKFRYLTERKEEGLLNPLSFIELPIGKFFCNRFENVEPGDLVVVTEGFGEKSLALVKNLVNNYTGTNFHTIVSRTKEEFHCWTNSHSIIGTEFTSKVIAHDNQKLLEWFNAIPKEPNRLLKALDGLLNHNEGSGCPMCDNGRLRDETKAHWGDCVWNNARKVFEAHNKQ